MNQGPRRRPRVRQANLFHPPPFVPEWRDFRLELRTAVIELISQMLRDKQRRAATSEQETTSE